jgi:hypothetical protein
LNFVLHGEKINSTHDLKHIIKLIIDSARFRKVLIEPCVDSSCEEATSRNYGCILLCNINYMGIVRHNNSSRIQFKTGE